MLKIVPYKPKYQNDLREVCLNTAYPSAHEPIERNYLLNTYCDYYLEDDGAFCFAAVDENDTAQGYILCAHNYRRYLRRVRPYVKQAKLSGFDHYAEGIGERFAVAVFGHRYPAHMHIDINPGFQRMGAGSRLVDALINKLREENIPSVMLIAGSGNDAGISFYKKYGFKMVLKIGPAAIMAYDIKPLDGEGK